MTEPNSLPDAPYREIEHSDACFFCKRFFERQEVYCLGDEAGKGVAVCVKCKGRLTVFPKHMPRADPPCVWPPDEARLWRYMDFAKFVALLAKRQLFFARADRLSDAFEGAKGLLERKEQWDKFYRDFFRDALSTVPGGSTQTPAEIEAQLPRMIRDMEQIGERDRRSTYISCWHRNAHESEAMWRLYSGFVQNAIAVVTTVGRLRRSLGEARGIRIGEVEYIDLASSYAGINQTFWRKRLSFQHEREVRAIIRVYGKALPDHGIVKDCDLDVLIESVFISPEAPGWFAEVVDDTMSRYGVNVKAQQSSISRGVFF